MSWVELTKDAISEVMETMFFNVVEFVGDEDNLTDNLATSHIELESPDVRLMLMVKFDVEFAKQVTADFLGLIPEEVEESDVEDCMKELANMLAGSVIARSGIKFVLKLPVYGEPEPPDGDYTCSETPLFVFGSRVGTLTVCERAS